ncbi:exopolyphosphatase [Arenimonas sp.]|jgi:exopolyphosphatase/guanosine-5'-triphosphate,3'-diphosphate pyrophosphatase|uniref:Ppx/GppA phosphatase family protein n=1 Tax=Arenimonas sp. TaxID=1872635 RepID=UPI0037BE6F80
MKSSRYNPSLRDGDLVAAVDLGSNSFHMVVARYVLGQLRIIDRIKEQVMLADGLDANKNLHPKSAKRALDCLALFGQRLAYVKPVNARVVATNTIRTMVNPDAFLLKAETAIGHRIEVIAGREEARLIYLGVAHDKPPGRGKRLVIDIGGGSTEFVLGRGFDIMERESLQIGCIANIHRFFPDGKWSMQQWQNAKNQIAVDMQPFVRNYRNQGWKEAYGASGTIKALSDIAKNRAISDGTLTLKTLQLLREELIEFGTMQNIRWPQISVSRRHSIAGGLLTLETAFEELDIECMQTSDYALREGALFDILGRNKDHDPRLDSVRALQKRYSIDTEQAERVEGYALALFDQARKFWDLDAVDRETLSWACKLHEIGLTVAHSHHHHHGSYLIEHSDISGFSKTEQQRIAILIRNQRRSIHFKSLLTLNESRAIQGLRCILLLRISILLYRSHSAEKIPKFILSVSRSKLQLEIPRKWLAKHPLTRSDLDNEIAYLKAADITLAVIEK